MGIGNGQDSLGGKVALHALVHMVIYDGAHLLALPTKRQGYCV